MLHWLQSHVNPWGRFENWSSTIYDKQSTHLTGFYQLCYRCYRYLMSCQIERYITNNNLWRVFVRNFPTRSGSYKFIVNPTCKHPRNHSNLLWSHWPFLWFLVQLWLGFLCPRTAKLLGSTKEKRTEAIRIEYQDKKTQLCQ